MVTGTTSITKRRLLIFLLLFLALFGAMTAHGTGGLVDRWNSWFYYGWPEVWLTFHHSWEYSMVVEASKPTLEIYDKTDYIGVTDWVACLKSVFIAALLSAVIGALASFVHAQMKRRQT